MLGYTDFFKVRLQVLNAWTVAHNIKKRWWCQTWALANHRQAWSCIFGHLKYRAVFFVTVFAKVLQALLALLQCFWHESPRACWCRTCIMQTCIVENYWTSWTDVICSDTNYIRGICSERPRWLSQQLRSSLARSSPRGLMEHSTLQAMNYSNTLPWSHMWHAAPVLGSPCRSVSHSRYFVCSSEGWCHK